MEEGESQRAQRLEEAFIIVDEDYGPLHRNHGDDCHVAAFLRAAQLNPKDDGLLDDAADVLTGRAEEMMHGEPCTAYDGGPCDVCAWLDWYDEEFG